MSRFFWKTCLTFSLLILVTTAVISWLVNSQLASYITNDFIQSLKDKSTLLEPNARDLILSTSSDTPQLHNVFYELASALNTRITIVDKYGAVLLDSDSSKKRLAYLERPEIKQAETEPYGIAERFSNSVNKSMLYVARRVTHEYQTIGFVRVSITLAHVNTHTDKIKAYISAVTLMSVAIGLLACFIISQRLTKPLTEMASVAQRIRAGDYSARVKKLPSDDVGKLGDALNLLGQDLHRLDQIRRDFVANVSHEIKTPLTSIKGYVETLLSGAIDDHEYNLKFLDKINRNVARLEFLVQDILSLARIEAEDGSIKLAVVDWLPIILSVVARHEDAMLKKGIKLKTTVNSVNTTVMGDKEAMTQILENLLSNAIKYTPQDGNILILLSQSGTKNELSVADTGIGIPQNELSRIFERFYRVDKARSRDLGGTGLGLSIVKHLVSSINGQVSVESKLNSGSSFIVSLTQA